MASLSGSPASPALPRTRSGPLTIGIIAPSGYVSAELLESSLAVLRARGHRIVEAANARSAWRYFAGTDAERADGVNAMVADPSIDFVLSMRGGYGLSRIMDRIDWAAVAASRKLFCGYSDFTAFNLAALQAGLCTLHGPMLTGDIGATGEGEAFQRDHAFMEEQFWPIVEGQGVEVRVDVPHTMPAATLEGALWGGNLSMLSDLANTRWMPQVEGGIVCIEDIGEQPYVIERMFMHLLHTGFFAKQRAVLLGEFTNCTPSSPNRYPYSIGEAVETLAERVGIPVLTGLPMGHVARKMTLPYGTRARLAIDAAGFTLGCRLA